MVFPRETKVGLTYLCPSPKTRENYDNSLLTIVMIFKFKFGNYTFIFIIPILYPWYGQTLDLQIYCTIPSLRERLLVFLKVYAVELEQMSAVPLQECRSP